ncbi:MFS transporter [Nocardioides caldifontis]|uniref:MFS transporter n=1 Tax=Nocardioides caldifontis TaxID=2588938 RepID=UPI001396BBD1|nr:MFS transporter [Nocardioides caldifontis]
MTDTPETPSDERRVSVVLGLLFGFAGMGSAAAALAIAPMADAYSITDGAATWSISLYALMLGVGTAIYGRVADLTGPRLPMTIGLSLMTVGALVASFAPTFAVHLVGRLLQGAGAAAVPTLGAAVVSARYAGEVRAAAFLRVAGTAACITSLGPLASGLVIEALDWRFAIALPILGVLVVPLLWNALHVGGTGARLDVVGAFLVAVAAGGLVLLLQSPSTGVPVAIAGVVLLGLGTPAVARRVQRRPHGFLPLSVVRNPVVVRSALAAASIPGSWFALLVALPAVLLGIGWEAWQVGLALVPSGVVGLLMPRITGPVMARVSAATALLFSTGVAAASVLVAAAGAALESWFVLLVSVMLVTVSFGIGQPALAESVGDAVEPEVRGVALGVATLVFMVGGSIGSALVGGLGHVSGPAVALLVLTLLPLLGILLVAPLRRRVPA